MRTRSAPFALAAVLTLTLGACSAGGSTDTADSSASATASTTASEATASNDDTVDAAAVAAAATAFLDTLSEDQRAEVVLEATAENAAAWSNLPCGSTCRNGIHLYDLDEEQLAAAQNLLSVAMGTGDNTGYAQVQEILAADEQLGSLQASGEGGGPGSGASGAAPSGMPTDMASGMPTDMGSGMPTDMGSGMPTDMGSMPAGGGMGAVEDGQYSSDNYLLAMLGEPSEDGTWTMQFGGHHLAVNFTYDNGEVVSGSPFFLGVEPKTWTDEDGTEHNPLEGQVTGMQNMLASLSEDQLAAAKLEGTYNDVVVGPGEDGNFPEEKEGLRVSELSEEQRQLVLEAMRPWVSVIDDATAEDLMSAYEDELDETYIAYSGGTDFTTQGDYVRIDGPGVWIEFVCQNGIVIQDEIHYHTIYRDHVRDYGGQFSF